ncbi:MAG: iron-sulfur cluster assembly scaffold protein [Promethearchaeota archaeon]|nr:MAG: iron-sulfur cluster assembly scaffold protein [Candidatus Lokiarchaeota archaeon]
MLKKNKFDEFVENLQQDIIQKELEEFSERVVELFHNPHNWGKPNDSEITVDESYLGPCGDTMHFFFKIEDGVIIKANFITDGCGASVAAGSQTTLLVENVKVEEAKHLTAKQIDKILNLPDDHKHCAVLAVTTLKRALEKYK